MKNIFKKYYFALIMVLFVGVVGIKLLGSEKNKVVTKNGIKQLDYNEVISGEEKIDNVERVTFDAFLLQDKDSDGYAEKYRGQSINITGNDKLWIELKILGDVTLKDAYIEFVSTNVKVEGSIVKDSTFKETVISDDIKKIELNEINVGTTKLFYLGLNPYLTNDVTSYSKNNKVILKGTVVENGEEKTIEKEVSYLINWYGTPDAMSTFIDEEYSASAPMVKFDSEDNVTVRYEFDIVEKNGIMLLESTDFNALAGKLNGYDPISVKVEGINTTYAVDGTGKNVTASHNSLVEDNILKQPAYSYKRNTYSNSNSVAYVMDGTTGLLTDGSNVYSQIPDVKNSGYEYVTKFIVTVEYPHAASYQDGTATLKVDAWHDAYNNGDLSTDVVSSKKTSKTLIANYKCDGSKGNVSTILSSIKLGKYSGTGVEEYYIDKTNSLNMYNNIKGEDTIYQLLITPYVNFYNPLYPVGKIFIQDMGSDKINTNVSMDNFLTYYSIKFPTYIVDYLGASGYVKIIDNDTNEVIHVFTALDIDQKYYFEKDVRSITIETSDLLDDKIVNTISSGYPAYLFDITIEKKIDNEYLLNNVSLTEFNTWEYITTGVRTDWTAGEYSSKNDTNATSGNAGRVEQRVSARFTNGISNASIESDSQSVEAAQEKNVKFEIKTSYATAETLYKQFKDAEFMVKIPDEIMSFEVNDIYVENNTNVDIDNYEIAKIDGHKFLKIKTINNAPQTYNIVVDADIIADPTIINKTVDYELYIYNPYCHNYDEHTSDIYDVNDNNDLTEEVGYKKLRMNLLAPTEVITTTTLIDYNGETITSPLIGEISPDSSQATIGVNLINNSQFAIKDVVVIGKIGFVGNTYQIGNQDTLLGSEFNTTMISQITPPSDLANKVTIYYSNKEKPTADLNDSSNGWVENPSDLSTIKTYMIVVDDYQMNSGEIKKFTYEVDMPITTANLLKKTFFTHGVYYNSITDRGLVPSSVGSSKLGVTYVRKYDLNLKTYREGTNKKITPIKYLIEDDEGNTKTLKADIYGNITFNGLYVNQEYTLKQISISDDYEIDEEERTFKVGINNNDELVLTNSNNYRNIELTNDNKLNLEIENKVRYTVVIKNTDLQTDENIEGSKFKITGKGYESGYTTITNTRGELTLKGLYLDEIYTLEQVFSNGHEKIYGSYKVKVVYDKDADQIKLCVEKNPELSSFTKTSDSGSSTFNMTYISYDKANATYKSTSTTTSDQTKAYMLIDLTEFEDDYKLSLSGNYGYHGHIDVYVTDYYVSNFSALSSVTKAYTFDHTNANSNQNINSQITNAATSTGSTVTIKGGKKYYIYINQYPLTSKALASFSIYLGNNTTGEYELVKSSLTTTSLDSYDRVIQTIEDDRAKNQPVLNVQFKNQVIPKTTIKLVKKDAETGDVLKNAQYRVEGPSISGQGIILTTNNNGEATFEVYERYTGNDRYTIGLSNSDEAGYNPYTITEIAAPDGYALDTKPVTFYVDNEVKCPTTGTCDINNYTSEIKVSYENNSFKATSYDDINDIMTVEVHDYPIVKIVKTDSENGEVLPNTLFSISKVQRTDGKETLSQAFDVNGNPVGELMNIDGNDYHVVYTDANGSINLNLEMGQYKLKEIQASSDKYELSDQVYYFGVGETVPFQAEGLNLVDGFYIGNPSFTVGTYNIVSDTIIPTNDGGYVVGKKALITKYDKDGIVKWEQDFTGRIKYKKKYTYYDKDDVYEQEFTTTISGIRDIIELSNGDILVAFNSDGQSFVRMDSDGNVLWIEEAYESVSHFTTRAIKNNNVNYQDYMLTDVDNEIYSGVKTTTNNRKRSIYALKALPDGGYAVICKNTNYVMSDNLYQGFRLKDGSLLQYGKLYTANGNYQDQYGRFNYYDKNILILRYDNENDIVSGREISNIITSAATDYFAAKGYSKSFSAIASYTEYSFGDLDVYSDGSYIFSIGYLGGVDYAMKLDKNYNVIFFTPIVANGATNSHFTNINQARLFANSDGGFEIISRYGLGTSRQYPNVPSSTSDLLATANTYITDDAFAYKYDATGNPTDYAVRLVSMWGSGKYYYPSDYNDVVVTNESGSNLGVVKVDDGYIVASYNNNSSSSNEVILANGEKVGITEKFLIFKVNEESKIEWLKQYNIQGYDSQNLKTMFIDANGRLNITFYTSGTANSSVIENTNDDKIVDNTGATGYYNVMFEISDVVYPSASEAYTLNIENTRKEYSVNVSTGAGSTITIKNNGNNLYQGKGPTVSERVKYGDNSTNEIIISVENNYAVTGVKVNGKDLSYKVNPDHTITLDKIANIREDQNIEITTQVGLGSVVVHHYKENTEERIASDEIITGTLGTTYETSPVVSRLYSLITNSEGKYILPINYKGEIGNNVVVTYYYKENEVELEVNYYIENTEIELAPTKLERKVLGSRYQTTPANIDFYRVTNIVGNETGVLNQNRTTVTYFYNETTEATINVKYVDENGKDLSRPLTYTVERNQMYETTEATDIPSNYRLKNKTGNYKGKAEESEINVVYYYEVIPFNVSVEKKISSVLVNGEKITINDEKLVKLEPTKEESVIVYYDIMVKNTGDIKAKVEIKEQEVNNFEIYDIGNFVKAENGYIIKDELEAGEEKIYRIGYKWNQEGYGTSKNQVELTKVENEKGFEEPDKLDNVASAEIVLGIPTGIKYKVIFTVFTSIIMSTLIVIFILTRKRRIN